MTFRLIAVDMDGTLLTDDKTMLPRTAAELRRARALGVQLVLASGRPASGLLQVAERIGLDPDGLVFFGLNGSTIVEASTGRTLWEQPLPRGLARQVLEHLEPYPVTVMLPVGASLIVEDPDGYYVREEARENSLELRVVPRLADVDVDVHKILVSAEPEALRPLSAELVAPFAGRVESSFSAPFYFEFTDHAVDKGRALRHYCELTDLPLEQTMAFGDNHNDLGMLAVAGLGVAMGNAVPEAKAAADLVTLTNHEDGIAEVVSARIRSRPARLRG